MQLSTLLLTACATTAAVASPPQFELVFAADFPQSLGPTRFALADLDGDGVLDGVFPGRNNGGRIYLMRGAGDGSFVDPIEVIIGASTDWVEILDMDGDGVLDLVLAVHVADGGVAVLRGLGGFNFAAPVFTKTGRNPRAVAVGEDGIDGVPDLYTIEYGEATIRALAAPSDRAHEVVDRRSITPWNSGVAAPQWLGRADADGDDVKDLWVLATGSGCISVFPGADAHALGWPRSWRMPLVNNEKPGVSVGALADLTGDGVVDFITAGLLLSVQQSVLVLLNDGTGEFAAVPSTPVTYNGLGWGVSAGDLNGDGHNDVVMTLALPGSIGILQGTGGGALELVQEVEFATFIRHVCIEDVDGDCRPDLVAVDLAQSQLFVLRNVTPGLAGCGGVAEKSAPRTVVAPLKPSAEALMREADLSARVASVMDDGAAAVARVLADYQPEPDGAIALAFASETPVAFAPAPDSDGRLAAAFPSCGAGSPQPCNQPHATPGCFTTPCCELVCIYDPLCCTVAWTEHCVQSAQFNCGNLYCPSLGSCFETHPWRGCDDEECCAIVSRLDTFCGSVIWDELCVIQATRFCTEEPCTLPSPPAWSIDEEEPCYKRFNQGCGGNTPESAQWVELACGDARHGTSSTSSPRDLDWFRVELTQPTRLRFDAIAEFPLRVLLMQGPCAGPLQEIDDASAMNCGALAIDRVLPAGEYHIVLGVALDERIIFNGQPCDLVDPDAPPPPPTAPPFVPGRYGLDWQATLSCLSPSTPGDVNGDGNVDGADLAIVLGTWGACPGCAGDLNQDGVVDGADLAMVLGNWTG